MINATYNPAERDVWCDDYFGSTQYIMRGYKTKREAFKALCVLMKDEHGYNQSECPLEKWLEKVVVRWCPCGFWTTCGDTCCECEKPLTGDYEYMYRFSV